MRREAFIISNQNNQMITHLGGYQCALATIALVPHVEMRLKAPMHGNGIQATKQNNRQ